MALTELLATCGQVAPGASSVFYIIEAHDVESIPAVGVDGITVASDIVCKTGKKFVTIEGAPETQEFKASGSGDPGFVSVSNEFMFSIPGISVAKKDLMRTLVSCPVIILFKNKSDASGRYTILGSKEDPAWLSKADYSTGRKVGDKNVFDYVVRDLSGKDLNQYTGDIDSLLIPA